MCVYMFISKTHHIYIYIYIYINIYIYISYKSKVLFVSHCKCVIFNGKKNTAEIYLLS